MNPTNLSEDAKANIRAFTVALITSVAPLFAAWAIESLKARYAKAQEKESTDTESK